MHVQEFDDWRSTRRVINMQLYDFFKKFHLIITIKDIINKNYMESVLQVTANDELFMHDEQSPARTSIEKQRRRMEFRVGKRRFYSLLTLH